MRTLLRNLFIENWQRKGISVALAIVIWLVVNHSLTATRIVSNVPVRISNIPSGKTIEGLQSNGLMTKRITLTLVGNKTLLDELTSNDVEVVIDAADKPDEWIASIGKKNLISLNPEIDLSKGISRVSHSSFLIHLTKQVTEKIPIIITRPIGEAPRDYLFVDVWPYHLTLTVSGPEAAVKRLKATGLKLTFNLNDITKAELDALSANANTSNKDVVSFFVPDAWKQFNLPGISDTPLEIDDPQAKALRIDFMRCDLLPIEKPIPVTLFFPPEYSQTLNPTTYSLATNDLIKKVHGLDMIEQPLYAKGVSRLFVEVVRDMIQIVIIAAPPSEKTSLDWSIQFVNPHILEDRYVSILLSDSANDEVRHLQPLLREEYLRNRFRSYMSRFQFFKSTDTKLELDITLEDGTILAKEKP
jgi:hypothetical protein